MSQRGIHLQRFLGFSGTFLGRAVLQCAHVVQPVVELNDHHTHIICNGQKEFAQILALLLLFGHIFLLAGAGQLGDPVHQLGHLAAELLFDIRQRYVIPVLYRVMKQTGNDSRFVHPHVQQVPGYRYGMDDIGLPALPLLPGMDMLRKGQGTGHGLAFLGAEFLCETLQELFFRHLYLKKNQRGIPR